MRGGPVRRDRARVRGRDWSGAERAFDELRREHEQLRRLTPEETGKIVDAVCEAEEDERQSVARDATQRVRDKIEDEYEALQKLEEKAVAQLDAVLADGAQKDRHGKAREYRGKVTEWWASIEKMTRSLRGANHPVVAFMLREGQAAHKTRQSSSSYCDVSAFRMDSGEADCLKVNRKGKAFEALVKKDSDFAKCTSFEERVDCYTLCPDIDAGGELRATRPDWDEGC